MPSRKSSRSTRPTAQSRKRASSSLYGPAPQVKFGWLLGAAATAVAIGAAGAYLVLCVLFYQNQAMLIFHPSGKITTTPATVGIPYQQVAFATAKSGQPQLAAWWIPAPQNAALGNDTILYLHGASGSLSNSVAQLKALHTLGINVFAIDYRGFGNSAAIRPTEQSADSDALAAWNYLATTRHIPPANIVLMGKGAGAIFATHLAARQPAAGLVLAQISPTAHAIFEQDPRARLLPLFLLAKEQMNPAPELARLKMPKLFLAWPVNSGSAARSTHKNYKTAAEPKQLASLPGDTPAGTASALLPFLHQVLPAGHGVTPRSIP